MIRINGQADYCRRQAWRCRRDAARLRDPMFQNTMTRLAAHWEDLADKFDLAEQVSGFIQWQAQRVAPPPNA